MDTSCTTVQKGSSLKVFCVSRPVQDVPEIDSAATASLSRRKRLLELFTKHPSMFILIRCVLVHKISYKMQRSKKIKQKDVK